MPILQHCKNDFNNISLKGKGSLQYITIIVDYVHPLDFIHGPAYISMISYDDDNQGMLPHAIWNSDVEWDASVLKSPISNKGAWYKSMSELEINMIHTLLDEFGVLI